MNSQSGQDEVGGYRIFCLHAGRNDNSGAHQNDRNQPLVKEMAGARVGLKKNGVNPQSPTLQGLA